MLRGHFRQPRGRAPLRGWWGWRIRKSRRAAEPMSTRGKARVRTRGCKKRKADKKGTFPQQREEMPQKLPLPEHRELPEPTVSSLSPP